MQICKPRSQEDVAPAAQPGSWEPSALPGGPRHLLCKNINCSRLQLEPWPCYGGPQRAGTPAQPPAARLWLGSVQQAATVCLVTLLGKLCHPDSGTVAGGGRPSGSPCSRSLSQGLPSAQLDTRPGKTLLAVPSLRFGRCHVHLLYHPAHPTSSCVHCLGRADLRPSGNGTCPSSELTG